MSKTKKVPNLRFQGFTDDWKQRKLGEFYGFKNGLNKGKEFFGNGSPIVNYTDVYHNRSLTKNSINGKVQVSDKEIGNYSVNQGDIFFTRTSETIDEIGFPSVMLSVNPSTVFSGFLIRARSKASDPLDNLFKKYIFFTNPFRMEMMKKSTITTRALTSGANLSQMYISFPLEISEQQSIGLLISTLDKTITLHQHKLDQLKVLKEMLLQKLFANDQHDKPELRFKDFTDKWKKLRIGSLFTESTEKSATGQLLSVSINRGVYPFDETERKNNSSKNKSNYKFVEKYDIAYNSMRMWQGAEGVSYYSGIVSPAYTVLKPQQNSNPEFYAYMFKRVEMLNKFRRYSQGLTSDTWNLKFPILKTISLRTTDIKEQEKIVQLLKMVKDNISLQQKKLTQYQQIKKFLLQQMFI